MKRFRSIGLLAFSLCFTAACTKQAIPKPAFKATIESYYQAHPACLWDSDQTFPARASTEDAQSNGFDALVDQGLLTRTPAAHHQSTYQVSAAGQPFWVSDPNHSGAGNLCYGHRQVVSIDNASPAPSGPGSITIVSYHYTIVGAPAWASAPQIQAAFPKLSNNGAQMSIATLTDTNNGWQMNPPPSVTTGQSASAETAPAVGTKTPAKD